jgi:hypothetical protein
LEDSVPAKWIGSRLKSTPGHWILQSSAGAAFRDSTTVAPRRRRPRESATDFGDDMPSGVDCARFEDRFELQQETLSKATVVGMAPLLAIASALLFGRGGSDAAWHFVASGRVYGGPTWRRPTLTEGGRLAASV